MIGQTIQINGVDFIIMNDVYIILEQSAAASQTTTINTVSTERILQIKDLTVFSNDDNAPDLQFGFTTPDFSPIGSQVVQYGYFTMAKGMLVSFDQFERLSPLIERNKYGQFSIINSGANIVDLSIIYRVFEIEKI